MAVAKSKFKKPAWAPKQKYGQLRSELTGKHFSSSLHSLWGEGSLRVGETARTHTPHHLWGHVCFIPATV